MAKRKAKARNSAMTAPMMGENADAKYDCDTLTRAEEIKGNKPRFAAAKAEAKRRQDQLATITSHSDESEMESYAKHKANA